LALAEKPPLKPIELDGLPSGTLFEMPALTGSWARCMEGLRHPHTGKLRPITFDHDVAKGRDDIVLVHLNHRLVQMCLRLMRAEVWAQDDVKRLNRVDVRSLPDGILDNPAVVVISRLVITGGKHHRLHEELTASGGYLKAGAFTRETSVSTINGWLDEAASDTASQSLFGDLASNFERVQDAVLQTVQARSRDRLRNLENTLASRKEREVDNITSVLDELAKAIEKELKSQEQPEQLEFFTEDERIQVRRDVEALKARLARIPAERELEIEEVVNRYDGLDVRTFPVAVIFLVPASQVGEAAS
jgi:hypothetical protein